ncbi:MAG: glycosyltransferase family 1 protein [Terriglobales bacterium]
MIVAVDTWSLAATNRYHGYHVYAKRLLEEIKQLLDGQSTVEIRPFVFPRHANDANNWTPSPGFQPTPANIFSADRRFWYCLGSQLAAASIRADLLFCPTFCIFPFGLVPTVTMIADTTPVKLAELLPHRELAGRLLMKVASRLSRKIITISECSKRDIVAEYGVNPEKVTVTYLGYATEFYNTAPPDFDKQSALLQRLGIRKPYLLHHGGIHVRKNLVRLIEAFALLSNKYPDLDLQLVLAGTFSLRSELIREAAAKSDPSGKRIVVTGALPDEDMCLIVKGASLAVIPSLYEGFCLPLVEAMACGIPTIASNNSCLPEISGNVLRYFDPCSVEDIAAKMEMVLLDSCLSSQLSTAGAHRVQEFSWERCARQTLNILTKAYRES